MFHFPPISQLPEVIRENFPSKPTWSVDDIPSLTGKVVIVTGGNAGIGRETVLQLLKHDATVYMASRNTTVSESVIEELKKETGKTVGFLQVDFASLTSVRKAAEEFISKERALNLLILNAGVMFPDMKTVTEEGSYDFTFGVNVIGHHLFTRLLIPLLTRGYELSEPKAKSRIITVSSMSHFSGSLEWDTLIDGPARNASNPWNLYAQSKFAGVVAARELARRYGDQGIVSISLNPGNIKTDLYQTTPSVIRIFFNMFLYPTSRGALTQLWAGTSPEAEDYNGKYACPWARLGKPNPASQDAEIGQKLWDWLEAQVKITDAEAHPK